MQGEEKKKAVTIVMKGKKLPLFNDPSLNWMARKIGKTYGSMTVMHSMETLLRTSLKFKVPFWAKTPQLYHLSLLEWHLVSNTPETQCEIEGRQVSWIRNLWSNYSQGAEKMFMDCVSTSSTTSFLEQQMRKMEFHCSEKSN